MTFGHSGGEGGGAGRWDVGGGCSGMWGVLCTGKSSPCSLVTASDNPAISAQKKLRNCLSAQPQCIKRVECEGGGRGGGQWRRGAVIKVNCRLHSVTRQRCWEMSVAAKDSPAAPRCTPIGSSLMKMSSAPQVMTRDGTVVTATQVRLLKSGEAEVN